MPVAFTVRGHLIGGEEHAEELAGLQTADNGKPLGMSRGDVGAAAGTHAELGTAAPGPLVWWGSSPPPTSWCACG